MMVFRKIVILVLTAWSCFSSGFLHAQIKEGVIHFERKTNLFKRFPDRETQKWIGDENKYRIDKFDLYFNDTLSVFVPLASTDERLDWATTKNTVVKNLSSREKLSVMNLWGENVYVKDSLYPRVWKFTDSRRVIAKIECRQAYCQVNDSVRIYAWFTVDVVPSVGPESVYNLPGAILGLALEDGRVTYFATSIEEKKVDLQKLMPKVGKVKMYTDSQLRTKAESDFGSRPELKKIIEELFLW